MLDACRTPDLVTEITLQPVRRHKVDAAIFFSDIVVPVAAVGVDLSIVPGTGPVVAEPFRTRADLDRLPDLTPDMIPDITESVQRLVAEARQHPLIGFAGAPFTLASYLVEGGPSKTHERTKALMHGDPQALERPLRATRPDLRRLPPGAGRGRRQRHPGSSTRGWARSRGPTTRHTCRGTRPQRSPRWPTSACRASTSASGPASLLDLMGEAGADVVGVDYRVSLTDAVARLGDSYAVQGNLDPALLGAPWEVLEARVRAIVDEGRVAPGHIFNLGHGVPPHADPDVLTRIVEVVHEHSAR